MSSNEVTSKLLGRGGSVATTKEQTTVLGAVVDEEGNETGEMVTVRDEDRNAAMYLLGIQGSGKSSLIESMVYQDACKGHAIILLDPHYDLIKNVLSQLPQPRLKDTYLLDITDLDYPFGLNIFDATGLQNEAQAVDRVVSVFQKIFPSDHEGRLLKKVLKIITITLLSTPGMTLADIPRLLSDEAFRSYLGGNVTNRHVKRYWMEYNEMSKSGRDKEMYALKNRLSDILTNSMLENIIGQEKTTINFRRAIEEKQIILIKLPVGDYPDTAPLIGVGMVAELYRAIFSFADLPKEKRPGFSLYIDEFQNFATDDFAKIFTQARKYSVRTLVANQEREKITGENYSSVLTAFTMVAFRLTPKDAKELGGRFVDYTKKVKLKKVHWDVLERLGEHQSEIIHQFWEEYVLPVQEEVKQLQRTVNAVSYDESEYNSPTPSRQLQSRQAYLKALTELLVYTQKKGFVVDTLLEKYLEMLDWYFGYESIGSQKLDIERVQKKLDTLQARKNFFDKL